MHGGDLLEFLEGSRLTVLRMGLGQELMSFWKNSISFAREQLEFLSLGSSMTA
jgi:hypothetical protein